MTMRSSLIHPAASTKSLCLLPWLAITSAQAALSGWLDFNGQIPGEATEKGHESWIRIQSFEIDTKITPQQPGTFFLVKSPDRASPPLFLTSAKGDRYPHANLDLNSASSRIVRLEMEDVFVTSCKMSGQTTDLLPAEVVGLVFGRITYTYYFDTSSSVASNFDYRYKIGSSGTGTNPDIDVDGMPDAWEATYNLSIGTDDGDEDADGDGLSNRHEYQLGTDPRSGTSFFKAQLTPAAGNPGNYKLSWNSVIGKSYVIEWSPDLVTPFTILRSVTATTTLHSENIVNPGSVGFYRVRPQP